MSFGNILRNSRLDPRLTGFVVRRPILIPQDRLQSCKRRISQMFDPETPCEQVLNCTAPPHVHPTDSQNP